MPRWLEWFQFYMISYVFADCLEQRMRRIWRDWKDKQ